MPHRIAKALSVQDEIEQLPVTHQAIIPKSYLDLMGHMNVAWYSQLFSSSTVGSLRLMGLDRDYFQQNHAGSFALATHILYLAEVLVGKHVSVRTRLLGVSEKRFHFIHFLVNDDDKVLSATGEFVGTHVDMKTRRTAPLPPHLRESIQKLCDEHAQLAWTPPVCGIMKP